MKNLLNILIGLLIPFTLSAAEPVRIAAIFPKTGESMQELTRVDKPEFLGIRQAVEELNQQGGLLGRRILLLEYDDKSTSLGCRTAARQAVKDGCIAAIGSSWSSLSMAIARVFQAEKIPMISPTSTNPDVTLVGDYIFRACFIDSFQGSVMADFARTDLSAKTAVVLTNTSESYCIGLAKFFISHFTLSGGQILWEGDYLAVATDFNHLLKKAQQLNPDVIFVPGMPRDSGFIIKQARKMGIKTRFLGGDGWDNEMYDYGGNLIEGNYFCAHWHIKSTLEKSSVFVMASQKLYGPDISFAAALSYDSVMLLADAVKRVQSLDPARIRDALASTKEFKGVTGGITFDGNRNPINKSAVILKFEKGKSVYVKTIKP
jgi:branched-chain amino acid transport system substrate-binding protein